MRVIGWLALLLSVNTWAAKCDVNFSTDQFHVMQRAFDYGEPKGWGHIMAAIAWQESSAGEKLVRFEPPYSYKDVSLGVFQVLLKTAMVQEQCFDTKCAAAIHQNLLNDFEYNADHAYQVLMFWQKVRGKGNIKGILMGYNGGYSNSERSKHYAHEIADKVVYLKECVRL